MPRHEPVADALTQGRPSDDQALAEPAARQSAAASPNPSRSPKPSMSQLLASCAAATAVSTPPEAPPDSVGGTPSAPDPSAPEGEERRDAA
jgi:hypothetical protein